MKEAQIEFVREPKQTDYGTVAVFRDLYGNLWDLVEFKQDHPMYERMQQSGCCQMEDLRALR